MIPDEAVEAAARALLTKEVGGAFDDRLYAEDLEACREDARAALEAAAPHMLAEAWDEGYQGCYDRYMYEPVPTNPYRTAK